MTVNHVKSCGKCFKIIRFSDFWSTFLNILLLFTSCLVHLVIAFHGCNAHEVVFFFLLVSCSAGKPGDLLCSNKDLCSSPPVCDAFQTSDPSDQLVENPTWIEKVFQQNIDDTSVVFRHPVVTKRLTSQTAECSRWLSSDCLLSMQSLASRRVFFLTKGITCGSLRPTQS